MSEGSVMIGLWRGSRVQSTRASDVALRRLITFDQIFPLRIHFQRMIAASKMSVFSVLIRPWPGSQVQSTRALDVALRRLTKLHKLFLRRINFRG
jgi:hypothetical protein